MTVISKRSGLAMSLAAAMFLTAGACRKVDEADVEEGMDSAETTQAEGALIAAGMEDDGPSGGGGTSIKAADSSAAAVARGAARFQPAGCATVSANGNTLTYTLVNCTGRFGLVHVTGTVVAVLVDGTDGLDITVTGSGLKVNRATIDLSASAVLSDDGTNRKLVVATNSSGVGPRGNSFTRVGTYTVERNPATACVSLDGQWQLDVSNARSRSTTVTGLSRCDGMCPAAGGTIVHTGILGRTVTVSFDGSDSASWTASNGHSGTVDLDLRQRRLSEAPATETLDGNLRRRKCVVGGFSVFHLDG